MALLWAPIAVIAQLPAGASPPGSHWIDRYFELETARLEASPLSEIPTAEAWEARRERLRQELRFMLGLDGFTSRPDLQASVSGTIPGQGFRVEKVVFQSLPGLYVTGNLFVPDNAPEPSPAILYVCGHAPVKHDGVSLGNKTAYHHHGAWFARNGYVCLTIDTLQLGEIEGIHHGTYREGRWWWNARGYTPAGVEAWNGIRALDYLESRPEVDSSRMGMTGRSGGGAYTWWVAALDERVRVAVPVAGITSLRNHVVDGCVEGHCDCMYPLNLYGWDFSAVAALTAPRPLLISNTDKDRIFPLDGVVRVYEEARRIYRLLDAEQNIGLNITEGPHKDTHELRVSAFSWFDRFLKDEAGTAPVTDPALPVFDPVALRVLESIPGDQRNTSIDESFVSAAPRPSPPANRAAFQQHRRTSLRNLRVSCFLGWRDAMDAPLAADVSAPIHTGEVQLQVLTFDTAQGLRLPVYLIRRSGDDWEAIRRVEAKVLLEEEWERFAEIYARSLPSSAESPEGAQATPEPPAAGTLLALLAPRGIGPSAWSSDDRVRTHIRRRFMLLGQTLDSMRLWDLRRATRALLEIEELPDCQIELGGEGVAAGLALYTALFEREIDSLRLSQLPHSHRQGPVFPNVLRYLDIPDAVSFVAHRIPVVLQVDDPSPWTVCRDTGDVLGWPADRLVVTGTGRTP